MDTITITAATISDAAVLTSLINGAYRGEAAKKGWTTEADLLEGERINEKGVTDLINQPGAQILIARNKEGAVNGCVYLQQQTGTLYLGMLTVSPVLQNAGIGKQLLKAAEEHAKKKNFDSISMRVISVRHELIAWYERHGYEKTGEKIPFPTDVALSTPKLPLEFLVMKKMI